MSLSVHCVTVISTSLQKNEVFSQNPTLECQVITLNFQTAAEKRKPMKYVRKSKVSVTTSNDAVQDTRKRLHGICTALGMKAPAGIASDNGGEHRALQSIIDKLPKLLQKVGQLIHHNEQLHGDDITRGNILATALRSLLARQYRHELFGEANEAKDGSVNVELVTRMEGGGYQYTIRFLDKDKTEVDNALKSLQPKHTPCKRKLHEANYITEEYVQKAVDEKLKKLGIFDLIQPLGRTQ